MKEALAVAVGAVLAGVAADGPEALAGPYTVSMDSFPLNSDIQNPEEDKVSVWFPTGIKPGANATYDDSTGFKFISYAHGMFGGGVLDVPGYNDLLSTMASFGYIIGATHQCSVGCFDDCLSLRHDPPCFGNYYKKQLGVFDWAKSFVADEGVTDPFSHVDWSAGVGIAGHSMGGQATLFSSSYGNASAYDIRASVLHHAYSHSFPAPVIPFADFTGELDTTAPPSTMAFPIYEAANGSGLARALVDKTQADHHEPDITCLDRNGIELLAQYSVAWFKIFLDQTPSAYGIDFDAMVFGSDLDAVCTGGDGEMTRCEVERASR